MKLWPSDSFEIRTSLSLEEVVRRLEAEIEPPKWFGFFRKHKKFQGDVSREGFKISRYIRYGNSFLPVVRGSFQPGPSGISVNIRMRLHPLVIIFMCIWCVAIIGSMMNFSGLFDKNLQLHPIRLVPVAFLVFPWAMASAGFWFEATKQKRILTDILGERPISEQGHAADRP